MIVNYNKSKTDIYDIAKIAMEECNNGYSKLGKKLALLSLRIKVLFTKEFCEKRKVGLLDNEIIARVEGREDLIIKYKEVKDIKIMDEAIVLYLKNKEPYIILNKVFFNENQKIDFLNILKRKCNLKNSN